MSVTLPSSTLKRSIDRLSGLKLIARFGASTWPEASSPRLNCGPTRCISAARHSPRISGPSANSKPSERARILSALPLADLDVVQRERRRRQQPRLDGAGDAHVDADQAARLRLEQRAMAAPIDQQRTDQRRYQRQNDRDRQSEQGGLQRQLQRGCPRVAATRSALIRYEMYAIFAGFWRQIYVAARPRRLSRARRSCPDS